MNVDWWDYLPSILSLITAIAACGSAIGANRAANQSRRNAYAQLMSTLFDDYASNTMLRAQISIQRWKGTHGASFADEFAQLRRNDYEKVKKIDQVRRQIAHYAEKIYALWEKEFLSEDIVRRLISREQVEFLRETVEPLEAAINDDYARSTFEWFGNLYDIPRPRVPIKSPSS